MATHSSILAWRIPWTEEPGRLQSMGSQRVRRDWTTHTHMHVYIYIYIYIYIYTHTHIYVSVHIYLCVCVFIVANCALEEDDILYRLKIKMITFWRVTKIPFPTSNMTHKLVEEVFFPA